MASSDDAAKQRIITHMNNDHQDSVIRYVEQYGKVSRLFARNATVTDITLDKLVVTAAGRTHEIPFQPPMKSFREARERVVELDSECITALGRSKTTVKEYRAPKGFHAVIFAACVGTYILLSRKENVLPGSFLHNNVPAFANYVARIGDFVIWPMLALHIGESYLMAGRMQKHSVRIFSTLWFLWVGSAFIEGIGSFQRLDALVKEKEAKQDKH